MYIIYYTINNILYCNIIIYSNKMATVSIVVACYRPHIHYLPQLIKNLEEQTIKPYEVILAISELLPTDHIIFNTFLNVIIYPETNKCNQSKNRNRGCQIAKGDYIMIVDADDLTHSRKIELCLHYLEKYPETNMIVHSYELIKNT